MHFLIVQSGLRNRSDHFYNETIGWLKACALRNVSTRLLIHHTAEKVVSEELNALAVCKFQPFVKLPSEPKVRELDSFIKISSAVANTLAKYGGNLSSKDVVIIPFATERDVFGVAQYLSHIAQDKRPHVVFLFHHPDHAWTIDIATQKLISGDASYCRFSALELQRVLPARQTWYCATNGALASLMTSVMGVKFQKVPIPPYYGPVLATTFSPSNNKENNEPYHAHIGILGNFRAEKGSSNIYKVINGFTQKRPGRSIFLQVENKLQEKEFKSALSKQAHDNVRIFTGVFSNTEFMSRMQSLDLLLLPYVWQRYVFRISSLFAEATACGVPTVVPSQTWMARRISDGQSAGAIFENKNADSIVNSLVKASDSAHDLKKLAVSKSAEWARTQSTDALVGYLISRVRQQ